MALRVSVVDSVSKASQEAWDALVADGSPFLEYTFLEALERFRCASPENGWIPRFVLVHEEDGTLVGAAPGYVKSHSMGEFVYDHGWADAARRAGLRYYPKLIVGVPFTPVTGDRLLVHPACRADRGKEILEALLRGLEDAVSGCHGIHVLFDTEPESDFLRERGAFRRIQFQFHWNNDGYRTFEDWVSTFPSDKRNKIRRERRDLKGLVIEARTDPSPEVLDGLHRFHRITASQFGPWGHVYLSREVFQHLGAVWGHRLHAVVARDGDRMVGGAFNVLKGDRLYGRYWGASEGIKFLHFEVCYYRAIEDCIARGISVFEPGHGGGHKYRRGFVPTITRSNHWLMDKRLHDALARYCEEETAAVEAEASALAEHLERR